MSQPLKFYTYDIETYPNIFTFTGKFEGSPDVYVFEISQRKNQRTELLQHLNYLSNAGVHMVGFNNVNFDYNVIHELLNNPYTFTFETAYNKAQILINTPKYNNSGNFMNVKWSDRIVPQIDLYKINHFDNANKGTSLKALQFAMRSESVEDLPFEVGTHLTFEQMDELIRYNIHDVTETEKFLQKNKAQIALRKDLLDTGTLRGDVLNYSDVKIGTEYLITKIGRHKCFLPGNKPRKTYREKIVFSEVVLPKISFKTEAYDNVLTWFKQQVKYVTQEGNPSHECTLANLHFKFGVGGIHASVDSKVFESSETHIIEDIDITGAYVATAIVNEFAPEHLGNDFKVAYKQLKTDRAHHKKGTVMNKVLKLAGNGIFGNSDNEYSCFYDPKYAKQSTVNCQLFILQLVEMLDLIPGLKIIQANTDGITAYYPRTVKYLFDLWLMVWERETKLDLERVEYKKMWIRDVNNYLALGTDGKVKRKGAYWYPENEDDYDGVWNKDFSMMVVPKATSEILINGWNADYLVKCFRDKFDFMIRYKTPKGSTVFIGDQPASKTVRYYVSKSGQPMKKVDPPRGPRYHYKRKNSLSDEFYQKTLAQTPLENFRTPEGDVIQRPKWNPQIHSGKIDKKGNLTATVYDYVTTSIESGFLVKECNNANKFDWSDVNYDYYVEQIRKLLI